MAENATKCSAADGVTQTFDFCHGMPLMVRAVDFNGLYHEHQKALALLKDIDANMQRAWKDQTLSADAWPTALARRLAAAVG